ncbi:MAG: DUF4197 domain-containing protein [Bacteroidia bacterium]
MKKILLSFLLINMFIFSSCDMLNEVAKQAGEYAMEPTSAEMTAALKEALQVGTNNASSYLNKPGGYLNNERFKIPFPPDAIRVATKLRELGFGSQVDKFIETMNRGAEDAAKEAAPIFVNSIKQMSLTDARNILLGADNSATMYFKNSTSSALYTAFSPKIKTSLEKFEATKYWTQLTTTYNKIPGVTKVDTDLVRYATNKAMDGLFLKLADEEKNIRTNLSARVSAQLKKVFGWAEQQKKG